MNYPNKKNLVIMNLRRQTLHCFQKTNLKCKDTKKWKVKELREIYHIKKKKKVNQRKAATALLT